MAAGDTFKVYTGDGVTSTFPIPFAYDLASEVSVTRANGGVSFSFVNSGLISLSSPTVLAVGDTLTIKRVTNTDTAKAVFKNGSGTTGLQLNGVVTQLLRAVQEIKDSLLKSIVVGTDNTLDALSLRIKNVANAQNANDAVNKSQLDSAVVAAGNVPTPGSGNIGKYLKATTASVWAWTSLVASDISNATAAGLALLTAANNTAQRSSLGLGVLATMNTVTNTELGTNAVQAANVAANTLTFAKFQRTGTAGQVWASAGTGSDPVYVGSMTLLASGTVSAVSTLDLTLPSGYKLFKLFIYDWRPVTTAQQLCWRASYDSGSTYPAGTSYTSTYFYNATSNATGQAPSSNLTATAQALISFGWDNVANYMNSSDVTIFPGTATSYTASFSNTIGVASASTFAGSIGAFYNVNGRATNLRLFAASGNIQTLTYALYGVI